MPIHRQGLWVSSSISHKNAASVLLRRATILRIIKELKNVAYIDNTNLHKGTEAEGFFLDYKKFRTYLAEKLGVKVAYIFIGYVPGNEERYRKFQELGYTLIFKPTLPDGTGKMKTPRDKALPSFRSAS